MNDEDMDKLAFHTFRLMNTTMNWMLGSVAAVLIVD